MPNNWLRANFTSGREVGVDREKNRILGYVVAQEGPFKSEGRGEFDLKSLKQIVALMNKQPSGLKSRLSHPTLSSDGVGKFLGRVKRPSLDQVRVRRNGETVLLNAVRGDLHLDPTSFDTPHGNLGKYVMDLAESDPEAFSTSLVLNADLEYRVDQKTKRPVLGDDGKELPPLWRPTKLHASDVVDTGEAVDGILSQSLSADSLPDSLVRQATSLMDDAFASLGREEIRERLMKWLERYLDYRFGDQPEEKAPANESLHRAIQRFRYIENGGT